VVIEYQTWNMRRRSARSQSTRRSNLASARKKKIELVEKERLDVILEEEELEGVYIENQRG
jgi:hypothetical protein